MSDTCNPRYAFTPPTMPSVTIAGSGDLFPVRRIFCVARNYADHAREMGSDPEREAPFFFMKPADAVVASGSVIPYPPETHNLHHEIELVVAIGVGGANISPSDAEKHIFGYAVGLDMTRRDLQADAKKKGRPWDWGKGFDHSAPMAPIHRVEDIGHPRTGRIWLSVDGVVRQEDVIDQMIWSVADILSIISRSVELRPGDLIMTGTPAGVGPVEPGQRMDGGVEGVGDIHITIAASGKEG